MVSALPAGFILYGVFQLSKHLIARYGKLIGKYQESRAQKLSSWKWWLTPPASSQVVCYCAIAVLILGLAARKANPFIYFQF
jgi:hypothetical protein